MLHDTGWRYYQSDTHKGSDHPAFHKSDQTTMGTLFHCRWGNVRRILINLLGEETRRVNGNKLKCLAERTLKSLLSCLQYLKRVHMVEGTAGP